MYIRLGLNNYVSYCIECSSKLTIKYSQVHYICFINLHTYVIDPSMYMYVQLWDILLIIFILGFAFYLI